MKTENELILKWLNEEGRLDLLFKEDRRLWALMANKAKQFYSTNQAVLLSEKEVLERQKSDIDVRLAEIEIATSIKQ